MPRISTLLKYNLFGAAGLTGAWAIWTRNSIYVPLSPNDPIFSSPSYLEYNPHKNPTTHDLCIRRVKLDKIKPQLLEKAEEGKLVEGFCAGLWGGWGYAFQRAYLARKYQNDTTTSHQVWETSDLRASTYPTGTQITDHFEVISKTPEAIVLRCGDSPLKTGLRDVDGLYELGVKVDREKGWAEFRLKFVGFQGKTKVDGTEGPMPAPIAFAHRLYNKVFMESAIQNVIV